MVAFGDFWVPATSLSLVPKAKLGEAFSSVGCGSAPVKFLQRWAAKPHCDFIGAVRGASLAHRIRVADVAPADSD